IFIWQNHKEKTARFQGTFPVIQSFNWIRDMLQIVGRQDKVVCGIGDAFKGRALSNEIISCSLATIKMKRRAWPTCPFPMCLLGKNAVVQGLDVTINGQSGFK